MKVFADRHHGALSYSLHLLFEKRLGWDLFFPIGLEWRKKQIWQYSQLKDTVRSYLDSKKTDEHCISHYKRFDNDFGWTQKYLTFDQFKRMDVDIILCSVGSHEDTFFDLRNKYKPKAKLIRQIGNWNEEVDFNKSKNLMISTGPFATPNFVNSICYHQEFNTKDWKYTEPKNTKNISTFINCFPDSVDYPLWDEYKLLLPEMDFKMYGIGGGDGNVSPQQKVKERMQEAGFVWHVKLGGEGYGHVIHNAYALGRPCIVKGSYYRGKMAEPLLIDGETCIDLDEGTLVRNIMKIKYYSQPKEFANMSWNAYRRFKEVCDFNKEEKALRKFLKRLI